MQTKIRLEIFNKNEIKKEQVALPYFRQIEQEYKEECHKRHDDQSQSKEDITIVKMSMHRT